MSVHEEDDFELVLGNRQLFFLAVVLFGVFFSIGYTVGYSRGRESADEVSAATRQPVAAEQSAPSLTPPEQTAPGESVAAPAAAGTSPTAPIHDSSESAGLSVGTGALAESTVPANAKPQPARSASTAPSTAASRPPSVASTTPAASATGSSTRAATSEPRAETRPASGASSPSSQQAANRQVESAPQPTIAVPAVKPGAIYLQVLASRDADPAREALVEMREKGHPVTLDNSDPSWYRILIGPFEEQEAAAQYQIRLKAEDIDSFIRKL